MRFVCFSIFDKGVGLMTEDCFTTAVEWIKEETPQTGSAIGGTYSREDLLSAIMEMLISGLLDSGKSPPTPNAGGCVEVPT